MFYVGTNDKFFGACKIEGQVADCFHTFADNNFLEVEVTHKGSSADFGHGVGDNDLFDGYHYEAPVANVSHTVFNNQLFDFWTEIAPWPFE